MTFGEYILQLRERLNDMRKSDASLIVLPSEDGIRWTSAKLISVANQSFGEAVRLINQYALSQKFGVGVSITLSEVISTDSEGAIPLSSTILTVTELYINNEAKTPVGYIPANYYINYFVDDKKPRKESSFFTIMYDINMGVRKVRTINVGAEEEVVLSYILSKNNYTSEDFEAEVYLNGIEDLLLDLAERECRDREHNWERSKMLDVRILAKLGINLNMGG